MIVLSTRSLCMPPSIRWPMMFRSSACRRCRLMGSARPRLIGFALVSAIADRRSSSTGLFNRPSAVVSLGALCSDRCYSCSTWVSLLSVSAYLTSSPRTLIFTHGGLHQQLHSSGVEWTLVFTVQRIRRMDAFQQTDAAQPRKDGLPMMCDLQTEYPS